MDMDEENTITTITTTTITSPTNPSSILKNIGNQECGRGGFGVGKKLTKIIIPKTVVVNPKDPPSSASSERCNKLLLRPMKRVEILQKNIKAVLYK